MILMIKQELKSGKSKTWKLRPAKKAYSYGASKLADVISLDPQSPGIEGFFEFNQGTWWYVPMNQNQLLAKRTKISENLDLNFVASSLHIECHQKDMEWKQNLEKHEETKNQNSVFVLLVKKDGKLIQTEFYQTQQLIENAIKTKWSHHNYELIQKQVVAKMDIDYSKVEIDDIIDQKSRRQVAVVLGVMSLLVFGSLFGPKKADTYVHKKTKTQSVVIRTEVKPKEKPPEEKAAKQEVQLESHKVAQAPSGRVADKVKSLAGGRISQLLGKVSAQAAKSANIFVSQGVQAGTAPSGRAIASIGKVERNGNGIGLGSGQQVVISTAGKGGGQGLGNMGSLHAGRTGSGGVGLLEEESEISGGLDREVIASYIKTQLGNILYCYERQLSAQPELFGKVSVKFTIGPNGQIESRSIGDTSLKNTTVENCILQKIANWKFPNPQGGTRVLVTYPFLFKSTN